MNKQLTVHRYIAQRKRELTLYLRDLETELLRLSSGSREHTIDEWRNVERTFKRGRGRPGTQGEES